MEPVRKQDHSALDRGQEWPRDSVGWPDSALLNEHLFVPLFWVRAAAQSLSPEIANEFFLAAVDRLGQVAGSIRKVTEDDAAALGAITAEGDRIDRLNADNKAVLKALESAGWW